MLTDEGLLALFAVICSGLLLGRLSFRGFSLGTSGIIFTGLIGGHLGFEVPKPIGVVGLTLFVFCLGIDAGPRFFRVFLQKGVQLLLVGAAMIAAAFGTVWLYANLAGLPADLASGILAGALTSTPALGAASEVLPSSSDLAVGFGIAYPLGTLAVIVFVNLVTQSKQTFPALDEESGVSGARIERRLVRVQNSLVAGRRVSEISFLKRHRCQISRVMADGDLKPIPADFRLELGQDVLLVTPHEDSELITEFLGTPSSEPVPVFENEQSRRRVVATDRNVVGKTLRELNLQNEHGVTITRIYRHDVEFVPDAETRIQFADALNAIGTAEDLERFVKLAGHRDRSFDETDFISLAAGLFLGTLLGQVRWQLGGESFRLGLAGGPLLVGLIFGHFGRIGPLVGHFPRAARLLLTEIGLAFFLAEAGVRAGGKFVSVLQEHGLVLCLGAISVAVIPLIVGLLMTRFVIPLGKMQTLGAVCGAMTSTPGLGAITSKVDSRVPVTSYAAVYPLALILMSLLAPILVSALP